MSSIKLFYRRALNLRKAEEAGNGVGSQGEDGSARDAQAKMAAINNLTCNPNHNNGTVPPGCAGVETIHTDADLQPGYSVLGKETLPADAASQEVQKLAVDMIVEPVQRTEPVDVTSMASAAAQIYTVTKRAYIARQQVVYDALHATIADRFPGSGTGNFITGLRTCNPGVGGDPDSCASLPDDRTAPTLDTDGDGVPDRHDPSYREVMRALIKERWWSPARYAEFSDNPAQVRREMAGLEALNLVQQQDYYDLMERLALLLAVQVSIELDETDVNNSSLLGTDIVQ